MVHKEEILFTTMIALFTVLSVSQLAIIGYFVANAFKKETIEIKN